VWPHSLEEGEGEIEEEKRELKGEIQRCKARRKGGSEGGGIISGLEGVKEE
jgi:hypothetical protein